MTYLVWTGTIGQEEEIKGEFNTFQEAVNFANLLAEPTFITDGEGLDLLEDAEDAGLLMAALAKWEEVG